MVPKSCDHQVVDSWNPIIYGPGFSTIPGGFLAGFQNHQQ